MELQLSPGDYVSILVSAKAFGNTIIFTDPVFVEQRHYIFGANSKQAIALLLPSENAVMAFMAKVAKLAGFRYECKKTIRGNQRWIYHFTVTEILPDRGDIQLETDKLTRGCLTHIVGPLLGVSPRDYLQA